jgi:hypothetical protein
MIEPTARRRPLLPMPLALRANAVLAAVVGLAFLAATWKELYDELDSFRPVPWVYAQIAGGALLGLAYLAWAASTRPELATFVARAAAITNVIAFACIAIWLFSDDEGIPSSGTLGSWIFDVVAVTLLVLAIVEARAFRKPRP